MLEATIQENVLQHAAEESLENFVLAVADAIEETVGGTLTMAVMQRMSADQITLIAYKTLREEVLAGGFIQLIHNGYGAFIFVNPFAKALSLWGIADLSALINKAHKLYNKHHTEIEKEMSDDDFMALYEQYPAFDTLDETFVESEERFTAAIACYLDDHLSSFVTVKS